MKNLSAILKNTVAITALLTLPTVANAAEVSSNGGLMVGSKSDPYWFKVGGTLRLDQRIFLGGTKDKGTNYKTGANLRDISLDLDGGIGENYTYSLDLNFNSKDSKVDIGDAFVTYLGLKDLFEISVGQVNPGFCLETTTSSKWTPFLERSMPSVAFGACPGLGVTINRYTDNYLVIVSATQPKMNSTPKRADGTTISRDDRWQLTARAAKSWHYGENKILQFGASGHIQDDSNSTISFSTAPEAKARNITTGLNTGDILAKSHRTFDFEISSLWGPLYAEVEYQKAIVNRSRLAGAKQSQAHFNGYHAQIAYVVTGESRKFNPALGTFGQVIPNSPKGAWEIAGRYSYVNLNAKGITNGGSAHNTSAGVNYYANENIRISGEYIYSNQRAGANSAATNTDRRGLHSIGLRFQVVV